MSETDASSNAARPSLSDLQRAEAAYLAANWSKMPRSERRSVIRLWWRTGVRFADTFDNHWRHISNSITTARFA
jgi:hypothetical protein